MRVPIAVSTAVTIGMLLIVGDGAITLYALNQGADEGLADIMEATSNARRLTTKHLKANDLKAAQQTLSESIFRGDIAFYSITQFKLIVAVEDPLRLAGKAATPKTATKNSESGSDHQLAVSRFDEGQSSVVMGFHIPDKTTSILTTVKSQRHLLLLELISFLVLVFGGAKSALRGIRRIAKNLALNGGKTLAADKRQATELDIIQRGISAQTRAYDRSETERLTLSGQMLSGPLAELRAGKSWPYTFGCCLVRTDLNGYTKTYISKSREEMVSDLAIFFGEMSSIIHRHGGFIYEMAGDEVLYWFKDEDSQNSAIAAICALEEINIAATSFSEQTLSRSSYYFHLKSSVSCGELTIPKPASGQTKLLLHGLPLIVGQRLLKWVKDKSRNEILLGQAEAHKMESVASFENLGELELESLGAAEVFRFAALVPIIDLLNDSSKWKLAQFYRSESSILEIIRFLRMHIDTIEESKFLTLVSYLRLVEATYFSDSVRTEYLNLFTQVESGDDERRSEGQSQRLRTATILSALLMASKSLFPKQERGDSLSSVFETTSRLNDSRLTADTVEVMGWFNTDNEQILGHVRGHSNNRVLANLLVVQASEKFGKAEAHLLKSLLAMDDQAYVASGLFALTEIVRRQATSDLVKFQTNLLLQDEINGALGFCASGNKMVAAQAQRLAATVISFSAGARSA